MIEIVKYLMDNYYNTYCPKHLIPDEVTLMRALNLHQDKIIAVHENGVLRGVAIFLTLSDEMINNLEVFDVGDVDDLVFLLNEKGPHLHFILLAAKGFNIIRKGLKKAKRMQAKTVSWWNPAMNKLHKYNLN